MAGFCSKVFGFQQAIQTLFLNSRAVNKCYIGGVTALQTRGRKPYVHVNRVAFRYPVWYLQKERYGASEELTQDNTEFIKEVVHDKYGAPAIISGIPTYQIQTPLKKEPIAKGEWTWKTRRTGLIGRKIGTYPLWDKDGKVIWTTLIQVADNHVVKYIPPEEYVPTRKRTRYRLENKNGCLLVGAFSGDPQLYTKEYTGLFTDAGLMPKRHLARFFVSPEAAVQPGTPLYASHFSVGGVVDVAGYTIYHGFQGVMKRHGFHGMPATHGVTKTHRRPGNIGSGGKKARVWPGQKMPGHMGNRWRVHKGAKIWRINTKYNVLYVQGLAIPGAVNSIVYVYDTLLPLRKPTKCPPNFPTYYPEDTDEPLPEDMYDPEIHVFSDPTITFEPDKK